MIAEPQTTSTVALSIRNLSVRFGSVVAVDNVDLEVGAGSVVGLIGPNGAGKTTLLDAISGLVPANGSISLDGDDITGFSPAQRSGRGLGRSFQDGKLFPGLTVRETLSVGFGRHVEQLGYLTVAIGLGRRQDKKTALMVEVLLEEFGLTGYADAFLSELSTGTRRIVDLASVVAHRPSLLLLDEPSSGIAQRESEALVGLINRIKEKLQCTILVVEHDMPLVTAISDELIAFETGNVIARGTPQAVVNDPAVIEAYLGSEISAIRRSGLLEERPGKKTMRRSRNADSKKRSMASKKAAKKKTPTRTKAKQ